MHKEFIPILLIVFFNTMIQSQTSYFKTDSTTVVGISIMDEGGILNSQFCKVKNGNSFSIYSPFEVNEYNIGGEHVYFARNIIIKDSVQKVFLHRLTKGKANLYYLKMKNGKTFFLEKDSFALIELQKKNKTQHGTDFRDDLLSFTSDCNNTADATKLVRYNKKSITKFMKLYEKCELKPFPHLKYGIFASYGLYSLIPESPSTNEYIELFDDFIDRSFGFGIFIDKPVLLSQFSLRVEINYTKNGYSDNEVVYNKDYDFIANTSSIEMPVLVRYSLPKTKIRPFINAGVCFSNQFKNETSIYVATFNPNAIEISDVFESSLISDKMLGYTVGAGAEFRLNYKNCLFFELRYSNLY